MIPAYFSVFPVKDKKPLVKWADYSIRRHTFDERQEWDHKFGKYDWGIATGPLSKILVLDDDGGLDTQKFPMPRTWTAKTPRGGNHYYFSWIPELNDKVTTKTEVLPKVDVRGSGGFVVFYGFTRPFQTTPLAIPPKWLIDLLPNKNASTDVFGNKEWLADALEGMKVGNIDDTLVRILGRMRHDNWTEEEAFLCLQPLALSRGATENHVREKIDNIWGRYKSSRVESLDHSAAESIDQFIDNIEPVSWLVAGMIPEQGIGFFNGLEGTCKTWALMDLAIEVSRGGMWLNRYPVKKRKVLFINQERPKNETQRRFVALLYAKELGHYEGTKFVITDQDIKENLIIKSNTSIKVDIPQSFDVFKRELDKILAEVIIVDSWSTFHTKEESSNSENMVIMELIKSLRDQYKCTFIFIDHENKGAHQRNREGKRSPDTGDQSGASTKPRVAEFCLVAVAQSEQSSMVYPTKATQGFKAAPFLVQVTDIDKTGSKIKVEAY